MTLPDIVVYRTGFTHCSICVPHDMSREDIEAGMNLLHPTGISSPWRISPDSHFAGGLAPHPTPCERANGAGRLHYLMVC